MNILVTIAYHAGNAAQTEKLLDHIYQLNSRHAYGHVLLAPAPDVHAEARQRIQISAELAFAGVHVLDLRPLSDPKLPKVAHVNSAFRQVAQHVCDNFTWSFLWIEPDCVPTSGIWLADCEMCYANQPKAYFGTQMKALTESKKENFFMARVGIYPKDAVKDIFTAEFKAPFELMAAPAILPKFTATKKIQQTAILNADDVSKVRHDAVIVHGDKHGHLLDKLVADRSKPNPDYVSVAEPAPAPEQPVTITAPRRGRPPKSTSFIVTPPSERNSAIPATV